MADSQVQPTRAGITERASGMVTRAAIGARDIAGRGVVALTPENDPNRPIVTPVLNYGDLGNYRMPADVDLTLDSGIPPGGQPQQPMYGDGDPFRIAADLFSRFYGGAPVESPQSPVVVGDASIGSSGGSNTGLIIILLVVVGGGYFIYRRYAQ
jgi:hypothetical protein